MEISCCLVIISDEPRLFYEVIGVLKICNLASRGSSLGIGIEERVVRSSIAVSLLD